MTHVIAAAIYYVLLAMPFLTCLWLLASICFVGKSQKPTAKLAVSPLGQSPKKTAITLRRSPSNDLSILPTVESASIPSPATPVRKDNPKADKAAQKPLDTPFATTPKIWAAKKPSQQVLPDSSSALFQPVSTMAYPRQALPQRSTSPIILPSKRRHSIGASPTKLTSKKGASPLSRPRSNSHSESRTRSKTPPLVNPPSTLEPELESLKNSLEGVHGRILDAYLALYVKYSSSFSNDTIQGNIFVSQRAYLRYLKSTGDVDTEIADVCEKLLSDCDTALAYSAALPDHERNSALNNFYRAIGLLWLATVTARDGNPNPSPEDIRAFATHFFKTVGHIQLHNKSSNSLLVNKSVRICLNAATTMLFENLSPLFSNSAKSINLVTPENIRWAYPKKINQATAALLSKRYTTPDLAALLDTEDLQRVAEHDFAGLSYRDQQRVMGQVNKELLAEYSDYLSMEIVKSTLKDLNVNAEYITLDHPDITQLYKTVQFRKRYIDAVRNNTKKRIVDSLDAQKNGQPDLNKIPYLQKILSNPTFSTLCDEDQIATLDKADSDLTEMYRDTIPADTLSSTLQSLRPYAPRISINSDEIKTLAKRLQLTLDYVSLITKESARLLTNRYDRDTNTMPTYDELMYLQNIKITPIFSTLNLDDQTAVLDQVKTILTEKFARTPLSDTLATTLQQLSSDTSGVSIACQDIETLYSSYELWMPLSTHSPSL